MNQYRCPHATFQRWYTKSGCNNQQQNDLLVRGHNGRHDLCSHAKFKLQVMVEKGSKGHDLASLKFKIAARSGDPKLLAKAMKSCPGVEVVNTRDCALEGSELFGLTKQD